MESSVLQPNEKFGKEYKLCSLKDIDTLFKNGKTVSTELFRMKFLHSQALGDENSPFKVLISVPKRLLKRAHDRNKIKRLTREGIRKNKEGIHSFLETNNLNLDFALIYQGKADSTFLKIESDYKRCLQQMIKKIQNEKRS